MEAEIDTFAKVIRKDPKLAKGFDAIGFSQGNLIIRGYAQKYNDPPLGNWISVHGPLMGVSGFPDCNYSISVCRAFDQFLGAAAYTDIAQHSLAQANFFRDPERIPEYIKGNIFLPPLNNEIPSSMNATYKANLMKVLKIVAVKAMEDTEVWPNESEWWGFYADGDKSTVLPMKDTAWYKKDLFGLQSMDKAGKLFFESTPGNHLRITPKDLLGWIDKYFTD
eukprot:NODE_2207_length_818_cov_280.642393_g1545_i0.p1 GENE.NODE_2207_length_818_cov_280.642393_g1545_i0~~NODE_2207_length_818_cov_280.642393_g1545_i0.p1  ORF type:complete len:231 (+),score=109.11 NODE_2207_length_818_cov_280.642393_g1545_i0:29-694(+)